MEVKYIVIESKHNYSSIEFIKKLQLIRNLDFYLFNVRGFDGNNIESYFTKEEIQQLINELQEIIKQ
jgi:hypothetical protein